jgi:hypothetical protein
MSTIDRLIGSKEILTEASPWNENTITHAILGAASSDPDKLTKGLKTLKRSQLKRFYAAVCGEAEAEKKLPTTDDDEEAAAEEKDFKNAGKKASKVTWQRDDEDRHAAYAAHLARDRRGE